MVTKLTDYINYKGILYHKYIGCLLHVYNMIPLYLHASVGFVTIQFPVFVSQYSPANKAAKPALVPNKPPIPYIPRVLSPGVKRPTEALSWLLNNIYGRGEE